jgi:alpha/beta superfamily hydrolase
MPCESLRRVNPEDRHDLTPEQAAWLDAMTDDDDPEMKKSNPVNWSRRDASRVSLACAGHFFTEEEEALLDQAERDNCDEKELLRRVHEYCDRKLRGGQSGAFPQAHG